MMLLRTANARRSRVVEDTAYTLIACAAVRHMHCHLSLHSGAFPLTVASICCTF